ncbi:hypothetical protein HPB50_027102 [Hyalomma asiaticum]|uniref:Uncharacterized protein n=1 Tax=Hyalomma asiaticum TaxID=266040 RepID=A0ACB7T2N3_HYAAI|nr:hypothetical protein HPB50_027102 [Hyalomma asiaticum]
MRTYQRLFFNTACGCKLYTPAGAYYPPPQPLHLARPAHRDDLLAVNVTCFAYAPMVTILAIAVVAPVLNNWMSRRRDSATAVTLPVHRELHYATGMPWAAVESNSFLANLFMGEASLTQIFPFPDGCVPVALVGHYWTRR